MLYEVGFKCANLIKVGLVTTTAMLAICLLTFVTHEEAERIWEQRFFPAEPLGPTPTPGRAFFRGARLAETLAELERKLVGVAIQGTVARMGEVALLAFDPAKRGSEGLVDVSATTHIELMQLAGRSWVPERR